MRPAVSFTDEEVVSLTDKIQDAANVVINLKAGTGSSTLSIAYAASKFATSLMEAMLGKDDVVQCAYVKSDVTEASYFASPLRLGVRIGYRVREVICSLGPRLFHPAFHRLRYEKRRQAE